MSKCECGRELRPDEKQCPACCAKKSHGWKRAVEVITGVFAAALLIAAKVWDANKSA